jgi:AraC-like DNA-binding protein
MSRKPIDLGHGRFTELNALPIALRLGSFKAEMIYWGFFSPKWWRNYLHTHSFYEICYAYAGTGTFEMLGKVQRVRAGDVFIAKPGEPHEIICSRENPLGIYFWGYSLVPDRPRGSATVDAQVDALLDGYAQSRKWVSRRGGRTIQRTLELLNGEIAAKQAGYASSINGLAAKLLLDTARSVVDHATAGPEPMLTPGRSATDAVVQTAVRYLRDNYSRPIGLRDLAAQVHLSERHLSRLFQSRIGASIVDHLTSIRIDAACQLLMAREMPIKQIAVACGYPDVHYFTTLFRKKTGLAPAAYREAGGTKFLRRRKQKF